MLLSVRHGTRCAGEVAAVANNNICVVGVAPRARVGGKLTRCAGNLFNPFLRLIDTANILLATCCTPYAVLQVSP